MAGVDLRAVAELMGHSSIRMTMRCARLCCSAIAPPWIGSRPFRILAGPEKPRNAKAKWSLNRSQVKIGLPNVARKIAISHLMHRLTNSGPVAQVDRAAVS
jgi:hypothetical protein